MGLFGLMTTIYISYECAHIQINIEEHGGYLAKKDSLSLSCSLICIILIYFKMQTWGTCHQC